MNLRYNLRNMKAVQPFMATRQITRREIQEIISFVECEIPNFVLDEDDANENKAIIESLRFNGPIT